MAEFNNLVTLLEYRNEKCIFCLLKKRKKLFPYAFSSLSVCIYHFTSVYIWLAIFRFVFLLFYKVGYEVYEFYKSLQII